MQGEEKALWVFFSLMISSVLVLYRFFYLKTQVNTRCLRRDCREPHVDRQQAPSAGESGKISAIHPIWLSLRRGTRNL